MNNKIIVTGILLIASSIMLSAQEAFLKLDSIQVVDGTLIKTTDPSDSRFRIGVDSIVS